MPSPITTGGAMTTTLTPTSTTVIRVGAGYLAKILVTAANSTNPINFYDSSSAASGVIIGVVPANAAVGTLYDLQMPFINGLVAGGVTGAATITVAWS